MHSQHSHITLVGLVKTALTHEGGSHRRVQLFRQLCHFLRSTGGNHTAAGVQEGLLGFFQQLQRLFKTEFLGKGEDLRGFRCFGGVFAQLGADVLGNIHQHRAFSSFVCQPEGFPDGVGQLIHVFDNVIVLGDGHGHAGDVHFLKAVQSQQIAGHVAGNGHYRNGIHIGGGNAGDQIGGAGAGSGDAHAYPSGSPGIAVCCVGCTLFMGGFNMANLVAVLVQGIINIQDCAAGIPEYGIHALFQQALHDDI